ncbi:MAG TPA: hypothetical protein VEI07_16785, partial [Planctomycetaceae bacterium]|nr:hypothetical protein [Planctomycetaceae bacterium]
AATNASEQLGQRIVLPKPCGVIIRIVAEQWGQETRISSVIDVARDGLDYELSIRFSPCR